MNDFKLNTALAELSLASLGDDWKVCSKGGDVVVYNSHITTIFNFNDWNLLMPLALENHIQIYVHSKDHYNIDDNIAVHKSNVRRVIAECLSKVSTK